MFKHNFLEKQFFDVEKFLLIGKFFVAELIKKNKMDASHDITHFEAVMEHVKNSLVYIFDKGLQKTYLVHKDYPDIKENITCLLIAAYLHDIDDRKYSESKEEHKNTRKIMSMMFRGLFMDEEIKQPNVRYKIVDTKILRMKDIVCRIIDTVSFYKNKNTIDPLLPRFFYLVRDADRVEAMGEMGVLRCYQYSKHKGMKMFVEGKTIRLASENEIQQYLPLMKQRFEKYDGKSISMMDHFYDKLIHLKQSSGCKFFTKLFRKQMKPIKDFIIYYGIKGVINMGKIKEIRKKLGKK